MFLFGENWRLVPAALGVRVRQEAVGMKLPKPGTERAEGPRCNFENRTWGKMRGVAVWWSGFERDCTVVVLCCKFEGEAVLKANPFTPDSGHSQRQLRADCVEEVGCWRGWLWGCGKAAHPLRPLQGLVAGSAWPFSAGSGRWRRGGTRPWRRMDLEDAAGRA